MYGKQQQVLLNLHNGIRTHHGPTWKKPGLAVLLTLSDSSRTDPLHQKPRSVQEQGNKFRAGHCKLQTKDMTAAQNHDVVRPTASVRAAGAVTTGVC